jgi:cell wall-associated NlpC family hydrolase
MGTPYLFGGISTSGIDCSALIQTIFSSALNMTLPRTTEEQIRLGWRVRRNQLDVGDLVFFRPDGRGRHAGIVLSEREFLHASTSQGVMISHLDEPYWRQWYHTGRRVVDDRWSPLERLAESSGN